MPQPNEYFTTPVSPEMLDIAKWVAARRILYEYPGHDPQVFGDYGAGHTGTIVQSLLAEMATFDYLHDELVATFGCLAPRDRNQAVANRLSMGIIVGRYDSGHDLQVVQRTLDVKSYGTRKVDPQEIGGLNLLVNANEVATRPPSDLYVQAFFTTDDNIVLAGYHQGLPPLNPNFPSPAHACPVPDLSPMAELRRMVAG